MVFPGEQGKEPVAVKVDNCTNEYCSLIRNEASKMEFTFTPDTNATALSGALHAQVFGAWFPWSLGDQSNVCSSLITGKCPVKANTEATYGIHVTIPFYALPGTRMVELRITNQNETIVACTRFLIQV